MVRRRNRLGEFVTRDGSNKSIRAWVLQSYNSYVAARTEKAERECKGVMTRQDSPITGWRLLDPRQRVSPIWRSEELKGWLSENGDTMTYTQWKRDLEEQWQSEPT